MKLAFINKQQLRCPRCHRKMVPAVSMRGTSAKNWMRCSDYNCKTFVQTIIPLPHQYNILKDPHKEVGVFGGYGSGKTVAGYLGDEKHILTTPNGETLIGADTLVQINNTVRKDLEGDFPAEFVKAYNRQQNQVLFQNGHILHYRHLQNEEDLRSYNVTRIHILEASGVKHTSYTQLETRLRNEAAIKPYVNEDGSPKYIFNEETNTLELDIEYDWLQMLAESNPDSGWIKWDLLEKSEEVTIYASDRAKFTPNPHIDDFKSSHIIPTKANYYLTPSFFRSIRAGKPDWWIKRYLEGSFDYAEGLVYPNVIDKIVEEFDPPKHWQRLIGFDYGLNDNSHFVFGAMDWFGEHLANGIPAIYWYDEIVINNANIKQLAELYKRKYRETVPIGGMYRQPVMDAKSYYQRQKTGAKKTLGTLFLEQGITFKPAQMDLSARIFRTGFMIDYNHCYFMKTRVPRLIKELLDYKYPDKQLEHEKASDKPIDKNNHGVNAMEFAHMELPGNLKPNEERRILYNQTLHKNDYNPFEELVRQKSSTQPEGYGDLFRNF